MCRLSLLHRNIDGRPPHPPCGHLLPRGEKGGGSRNRRKCCALNHADAHNSPLGVRIGALTNKAAHYRFHLVRTGHRALLGLTSISGATAGNICRERRGAVGGRCCGVRKIAAAAHIAEIGPARTAHENVGAAQQNVLCEQDPRSKWRVASAAPLWHHVHNITRPRPFACLKGRRHA